MCIKHGVQTSIKHFKILISISAINPTYILHTMPENIQEHMRAFIAQHGSVLAALAAFDNNQKLKRMTCDI
jgi:hypothetical protein